MKILKFVLISLAFLISEFTSAQWTYISPLPTGEYINNVDFLNDNTGYISTVNFTVYKTTNGGNNWQFVSTMNQSRFLNDWMEFSSETTGFMSCGAISGENQIYKTTNGGVNWFVNVNSNEVLWDADFINENTGFYTGDTKVYKTTNAGINWFNLHNFGVYSVHIVKFYNNKYGSVIRNGGPSHMELYLTSDGGVTWNLNSSIHAQNISYVDSSFIYITNDSSRIYKSINGGVNWSTAGISGQKWRPLLFFENSLTGYTINNDYSGYYSLMKTINGGLNWINVAQSSDKPTPFLDLTQSNFYSVGSGGYIVKSTDKGSNWESKSNSLVNNAQSLFFKDINTGIIACNNKIIKTYDGGANWNLIINLDTIDIHQIQSPDNQNLFAACNNGKFGKSTDFGNSWHFSYTGYPVNFSKIYFINSSTGFLIKYNSNVFYRTDDGGNNWTENNQIPNVRDFSFIDNINGYAMSSISSLIYKTTDSGITWFTTYTYPQNGQSLMNLVFTDPDNAVISIRYQYSQTGFRFVIYNSTNAGLNWTQNTFRNISPDNNADWYYNLQKTSANVIIAQYGNYGLKSDNLGLTWKSIVYPSTNPIKYFFPSDEIGFMAGSNVIGKIYNGGTVFIYNEIKVIRQKDFHLSQNYPNPFNPKTIINYAIPSNERRLTSDVKLLIYNALGKEVATLVNEKQNAGIYSIEFNGEGLPSGIYFYKLETGDFSETKRMVLLK